MNRYFFVIFSVASSIALNNPIQAQDLSSQPDKWIIDDNIKFCGKEKSLLYLSCGYLNLVSQKYQDALDDYQKASNCLANSENPDMNFLIYFGMSVACDNLNLLDDSNNYMLRIRNLIDNTFDAEEESENFSVQNNYEIINDLKSIAYMSPSNEAQDVLISFISEIFPASLTTSSQNFSPNPTIMFNDNNFTMMKCKSFWKEVESLARRISRTWNKIYKIYKELREVEDDIRNRFTNNKPTSI